MFVDWSNSTIIMFKNVIKNDTPKLEDMIKRKNEIVDAIKNSSEIILDIHSNLIN